jgi:lysophospholipid acyltransferase (LPLAT)-like uncharacterized protein
MANSVLKSAPVQAFIATLLGGYMGFVGKTTRWERRGMEHIQPLREGGKGVIALVWHGRIMVSPTLWPRGAQPIKVLISQSDDGDIIARAAAMNGVGAVRGSSLNPKKREKTKGAMGAFREMVRQLRGGGCMAIMPDGPRGPRMRMGLGPLTIAQMTGAPIFTATWSTRWAISFKSWDRFVLPLPFSKGILAYGKPVYVPRDADEATLEALRLHLETDLTEITRQADAACGRPIVEPEPV